MCQIGRRRAFVHGEGGSRQRQKTSEKREATRLIIFISRKFEGLPFVQTRKLFRLHNVLHDLRQLIPPLVFPLSAGRGEAPDRMGRPASAASSWRPRRGSGMAELESDRAIRRRHKSLGVAADLVAPDRIVDEQLVAGVIDVSDQKASTGGAEGI